MSIEVELDQSFRAGVFGCLQKSLTHLSDVLYCATLRTQMCGVMIGMPSLQDPIGTWKARYEANEQNILYILIFLLSIVALRIQILHSRRRTLHTHPVVREAVNLSQEAPNPTEEDVPASPGQGSAPQGQASVAQQPRVARHVSRSAELPPEIQPASNVGQPTQSERDGPLRDAIPSDIAGEVSTGLGKSSLGAEMSKSPRIDNVVSTSGEQGQLSTAKREKSTETLSEH